MSHCISGESGGPVVHDFVGVRTLEEHGRTYVNEMRFVAPQCVREVPA